MGREERAAGALLWRSGADGPEVAVVHRARYDDWSLPKGKLDRGESEVAAAQREVAEETGYHARLGAPLGEIRYLIRQGQVQKVVAYWAMQAVGEPGETDDEVDELRWCSPADAGDLLSYPGDREVLRRFLDAAEPPRG